MTSSDRPLRHALLAQVVLLFALSRPVWSQTPQPPPPSEAPDPATPEPLPDPDADLRKASRDLLARPQPVPALAPVATGAREPVIPVNPDPATDLQGPLGTHGPLAAHRLLREGVFISRRPGWLRRLEQGHWLFVFAQREGGTPLPPVLLVPSPELQRAEAVVPDPARWTPFVLTGQVFAYHDWNYLIPTPGQGLVRLSDAALDPSRPARDGSEALAREEEPPGEPPGEGPRDPAVRRLLESLEDTRSGVRSLLPRDPDASPDAPQSSAAPPPDTGERFLVARRGRLARTSTGAWKFAFDTDVDRAGGGADRPAILVPSALLAAMEATAGRHGDAARFELSGRLFHYRGQPYLIPVLYRELPPAELNSMQ